jgi:hypothetical protein
VQKLISENGILLSDERAAREDRRVQEEFAKQNAKKKKTRRGWPNAAPNVRRKSRGRRIDRYLDVSESV